MDIVYDHTYTAPGTYGGKLRVVDEAGNAEAWKPFVVTVSDFPGNPEIPRQWVTYPGWNFFLDLPGSQPEESDAVTFPRGYFTQGTWDLSLVIDPLPVPTSGASSSFHAKLKCDHFTQPDPGDIEILLSRTPAAPKEYSIEITHYYSAGYQAVWGGSASPITNVSIATRDRVLRVSAAADWNAPVGPEEYIIDDTAFRLYGIGGALTYSSIFSAYAVVSGNLSVSFAGYTALI